MCECLLTSLERRFEYLLNSLIHQAATALDPRVKLSFTDHHREFKVFVFSSSDVKLSIKSLLPPGPQPMPANTSNAMTSDVQPASKKLKLLDFCSISDDTHAVRMNDVDTELQSYFDQPRLDVNPVKFWTQHKKTPLTALALQLLSIPCSSAPVERLFSKAGIVLSQRRTRTASSKLEKLMFLK